jgi:hypothetical protein
MTHQLHCIDLFFISVFGTVINSEIMSILDTLQDFLDRGSAHYNSISITRHRRRIKTRRSCSDITGYCSGEASIGHS